MDALSERPATVVEAFARDSGGAESLPANPEPQPETAEPAAAIAQPVDASASEGVTNAEATPSPGEPPKERWADILSNARTKEREAVAKEWEPYAWAKQVPRDAIEQAVQIAQKANTDPIGYLRELIEDLDNHPTHAQALRSEAARLLSRSRGKAVDLSPDVEIVDASGQVAGRTFSAERVQAIVQQAVAEALQKEVAPIKSDFEQRKAEAERRRQQETLEAQVSAMEARIKRIVGPDDDALKAVAEAMQKPEYAQMDPLDVALAVFEERSKATQTKADAEALKTLQRKAAASTPNPAAAVVPATKRPTSLTDPALKW